MYLSRIELNTQIPKTRRALASPQVLHAAIEGCFSNKGEKSRKLWRIDSLYSNLYIMLLSQEKPDYSYFTEQFCTPGTREEIKEYSALLDRIQVGQHWHFRLCGNATHNVPKEGRKRGQVFAHVSVEHKRKWLLKKAENCGFATEEHLFDVMGTDQLRFWKDKQQSPVTLGIAVYEGELVITDSELFKAALVNGIGRAKAYGCGLMTIARPI